MNRIMGLARSRCFCISLSFLIGFTSTFIPGGVSYGKIIRKKSHSNNSRQSPHVETVFIPDLNKTDKLAHSLSERLKSHLKNRNGEKVSIKIIHFGDITTFPKELRWLMNHLKHLEKHPSTENKVDVNLKLVSQNKLQEALEKSHNRFNKVAEHSVLVAESLTEKINEIGTHLENLDLKVLNIEQSLQNHSTELTAMKNNELINIFEEMLTQLRELENHLEEVQKGNLEQIEWPAFDALAEDFENYLKKLNQMSLEDTHFEAHSLVHEILPQLKAISHEFKHLRNLKSETEQLIYHIEYSDDSDYIDNPPPRPALREQAKAFTNNLMVNAKRFFGLPKGMTWIMYKHSFTDRTAREHIVEFTSAMVQAASLYAINFGTLAAKISANPDLVLSPEMAALTAAGWKLATGYVERANNAFFVQGIDWNPIQEYSTNRNFFLSSAYFHSIVIGMTVQIAARGWSALSGDIIAHTAWNSFLGLFAKALPLLLIAKHQQKRGQVEDSESRQHSKWKTIAFNFVFGLTYQGLKALHLFELDFLNLSTVFVALGVGGIGYELSRYFRPAKSKLAKKNNIKTPFQYKWMKFKARLGMNYVVEPECQTLLMISGKKAKIKKWYVKEWGQGSKGEL